jgi:hypothetical protein
VNTKSSYFTRGCVTREIYLLVLTRWNIFRSYTELNKYPLYLFLGQIRRHILTMQTYITLLLLRIALFVHVCLPDTNGFYSIYAFCKKRFQLIFCFNIFSLKYDNLLYPNAKIIILKLSIRFRIGIINVICEWSKWGVACVLVCITNQYENICGR